jgi:hypothetical protein
MTPSRPSARSARSCSRRTRRRPRLSAKCCRIDMCKDNNGWSLL